MGGLQTTLNHLSRTANESALAVLLPALDSPNLDVRHGALTALLRRREPLASETIIRRLEQMDDRSRQIVEDHPGRLLGAFRNALLGNDPEMCALCCRAALWLREYDLAPTLAAVAEMPDHPHFHQACDTLMNLVRRLYQELAAPPPPSERRDPQVTRRHVVGALELAVQRFGTHKNALLVEAFLLLVNRENALLKSILQSPLHPAFLCVNELLHRSEHGGVIRLLLSFLDDPKAPSAALSAAANRSDVRFLRHFLRRLARSTSPQITQNLKRIESITWFRGDLKVLEQIEDAAQPGIVRLAVQSAISRPSALAVIRHVLSRGKPAGRRAAAAAALVEFTGVEANTLALAALDDPDPQVQAIAVRQLRARGIPGALARVVEMVDSPYAVVRQAAFDSLSEFTFARYLGAFDMLDDDVRRSTGEMVRKLDPQATELLRRELESPARNRRLRGVAMARAMGLVEPYREIVLKMLDDEDYLLRAEAASAAGMLDCDASLHALRNALNDHSPSVQEAARESLRKREALDQWQAVVSRPGLPAASESAAAATTAAAPAAWAEHAS